MEMSIAQRLFVEMGKIVSRSDVKILDRRINTSGYPFKRKVWEKFLPEEMLSFYEAVNGMNYIWTFGDKDDYHGPCMPALSDGKKTIDLRTGRYSLPFIKVGSFGPLQYDHGTPVDKKLSMLMFDGSDDAAGAVMLFEGEAPIGVFGYDNDGYITRVADDFAGLMELGLKVGFCHMYRSQTHPITQEVAERLSKPVPPRKVAELNVEVVEECGTDSWRRDLGKYIHTFYTPDPQFNDAVGLMKRKEKYANLSPEERGALFVELFSDPNAIDDKKAQKMRLLSIYTQHKAKKDLTNEDYVKAFQCHDEPLVRIEYTLTWDPPKNDTRREDGDDERAFMSVEAFESLSEACPFDPDLYHFCPPALHPELWSPMIGMFNLSEPERNRVHRVAYFRHKGAGDLKAGTYDVSALPVLTHPME